MDDMLTGDELGALFVGFVVGVSVIGIYVAYARGKGWM